jgi:hypothetical protein
MARPRIYDYDALAGRLFDLLVANPDGLDWRQIRTALGLPASKHVYLTVRRLRMVLSEGDTINVPVQRIGMRSVYALSGLVDEATPWTRQRMREEASRAESLIAVWRSIVAGTDGRTGDGKTARHILKYHERLLEDIRIELGDG